MFSVADEDLTSHLHQQLRSQLRKGLYSSKSIVEHRDLAQIHAREQTVVVVQWQCPEGYNAIPDAYTYHTGGIAATIKVQMESGV